MPNYNTITGNVAPVSETAVTLASLVYAIANFRDYPRRWANGELVNAGTVDISVAFLNNGDTPVANQFKTIEAGESLVFEKINIYQTFVKTSDDTETNLLEFSATPTDED